VILLYLEICQIDLFSNILPNSLPVVQALKARWDEIEDYSEMCAIKKIDSNFNEKWCQFCSIFHCCVFEKKNFLYCCSDSDHQRRSKKISFLNIFTPLYGHFAYRNFPYMEKVPLKKDASRIF
jgi:hypothetical protein